MFQVPDIEEMITYVKEFIGEKRHLAVVDFGSETSATSEATTAYGNAPYIRKYRIADAFMSRSVGVSLIANFFILFNKPKVKTRLFTKEANAIQWLENLP